MAALREIARGAGIVAGGIVLIAASARVDVAMYPVPMTLQTLAVVALSGVLAVPLALATAAGYLLAGLLGLPVFADGARAPGLDFLALPSGGYVLGFVAAAGVVAGLAPRAGRRFLPLFLLMLGGHAVVVAAGVLWLARFVGPAAAVSGGLTPFVAGMVVKSAVAAALVGWWARARGPGMDLASVRFASAAPDTPERSTNRP